MHGATPPKISVITPCLNAADCIEQAIESVLDQDYVRFEHIVMDGGSSDGTIDQLAAHEHLLWRSEPDTGQSNAMNKGAALATGDLLVYLNADDYFLPGAFQHVAEAYARGARFVVGDVIVEHIDGQREQVRPHVEPERMMRYWDRWTEQDGVLISPYPNNPVQYFYVPEIQDVVPFNEQNHFTMDLEFLLLAARHVRFHHIPVPFGVYRLREHAKNVAAQRDALDYWRPETFPYVDQLLTDWPVHEVIAYKNAQASGHVELAMDGAFRPIRRHLEGLMQASLVRDPSIKIREYKALVDALLAYSAALRARCGHG